MYTFGVRTEVGSLENEDIRAEGSSFFVRFDAAIERKLLDFFPFCCKVRDVFFCLKLLKLVE